eukprot:m.93313 g.93313  ORF g.93313 m.93313 type:complete len:87 (-) comp14695_c0_seq2:1355-1615(-)
MWETIVSYLPAAIGGACVYVGVFVLLCKVPFLQRGIVYLNFLNVPFGDLRDLTYFRVDPGKPVEIFTPDGETLFGWSVLLIDVHMR